MAMPRLIKIGVTGCAGRMGAAIVQLIIEDEECTLAGGIERFDNEIIGQDIGDVYNMGFIGHKVEHDAEHLFKVSDVILDFTSPEATVYHAELAAKTRTAFVAGTTGLRPNEERAILNASAKAPIIRAANMSIGINLLLALTRQVASTLGPEFDIEILEMHHRNKVDAPSGTALAIGEAAAQGRGVTPKNVERRARDGITGERSRGEIGYGVLRGGNVAGEHSVMFAADNERIELVHKANDRKIFARGAVKAALWLYQKPPGLYSMMDVLGL